MSQALDRPLTARERLALRCHLLICGYCRRFKRQLATLCRLVRSLAPTAEPVMEQAEPLSPPARARIRSAIADAT